MKIRDDKTIYLDFQSICWFLFCLLFITANIAKHSIFFQVTAALFIITISSYLLFHRAIKINKYYLLFMVFIFYNFILIFFGYVVDSNHSMKMLKTISINLIMFVLFYSFLVYSKETDKLLKLYVNASVVCIFIILFIFRDSLFTGRLGNSLGVAEDGYSLLGIQLLNAGSNGIAYFSAISFLFSTYLYFTKKTRFKKLYLFYNLLFIFTIVATGSRKGLFVFAVGFILLMNIIFKKDRQLIYGASAMVLIIFIYYLTQNIPILYGIMGIRLEELFNLVLNKNVNDSSINTRMILIDMAINFAKESPIYGYGLDAFRILGPWGIVSDNNYLDILVSSGIIGFVIYYSYVLLVVKDYFALTKKSVVCRLFFVIFIINLIIEYGSVTYFERNFGLVNAMLFYILQNEKWKNSMYFKELVRKDQILK